MGPIMALGFSLCTVDLQQMRKALSAIVMGFCVSLAVSAFIVFLSPLTDATPEIMARTQPNLFDLLVAIFSGLAGGYATIHQKGAAIVGVAIATALMPPLAVVGYGIATGAWAIAQGAFFLFMTNLLAIALSVTLLAKWYGFGAHNSPKHTFWQTSLVFAVFILLSLPLGLSLSKIAYQSYVTKTIKAQIQSHFSGSSSRISSFAIAFKAYDDITVDCIIITDSYTPNAVNTLRDSMQKTLDKKVLLTLDQIVVAKHQQEQVSKQQEKIADSALANPIQTKLNALSVQEEIIKSINLAVFFPLQFIQVDAQSSTITIYPTSSKGINLAVLYGIEQSFRARFPDWSVFVVPPVQALPFVFFDIGQHELATTEIEKVNHIIWALQRWKVQHVAVVGYASTVGEHQRFNNNSLAYKRATVVLNRLEEQGIKAIARSDYTAFDQHREERHFGINSLHRVEIRLIKASEVPEKQASQMPEPAAVQGTTEATQVF